MAPPPSGTMVGMDEGTVREREKFLEFEKRRLYEEIRTYPTPIAGCDQQFNHLLEQQAQVSAELNCLRSASQVEGGRPQGSA